VACAGHIDHMIDNQLAAGSIPTAGAKKIKGLAGNG
jgi:hypothetical protein